MLSIDTNILFAACVSGAPCHQAATSFCESHHRDETVIISEFVLIELYSLVRNPAVMSVPLSTSQAVHVCSDFRNHPSWRVVALPPGIRAFHDELWSRLAEEDFPRRRVFDLRLGLSLIHQGVTDFATANVKDFRDIGFRKVLNPLK